MKKKKKTQKSNSNKKAKSEKNDLGSITRVKYEDWKVKWLSGIQVNGNPNIGGSDYNQDILLT
jgi:hypothetical protein